MIELLIPRENANDDFVLITEVNKASGDTVAEGDTLFAFETSKAAVEFTAPAAGTLAEFTLAPKQRIAVESVIGRILGEGETAATTAPEAPVTPAPVLDATVKLSDAAAALVAQGRQPNGNGKWLTSRDFGPQAAPARPAAPPQDAPKPKPDLAFQTQPLTQRKVQEHKALAWSSPYLNSTIGIAIHGGKRAFAAHPFFAGSILDLLLYEIANLLRGEFRDLNGFYAGDETVGLYDEVIPGLALDSLNNLVVVRVTGWKTLAEISRKVIDLVEKFETGKLAVEDYRQTTFTISDLSNTGANFTLPLVNGPQAFILAVNRTPDGFQLYGTFDHRVTEGLRFSRFLEELKRRVELALQSEGAGEKAACHFCDRSIDEEKALKSKGLLRIFDGTADRLVCRNCYEGW